MPMLFPNAFGELPRHARLAAASRHPAQKADLLDVAQGWLALAGIHEGELEDNLLKNVAGW
jgi:hypothetical protein